MQEYLIAYNTHTFAYPSQFTNVERQICNLLTRKGTFTKENNHLFLFITDKREPTVPTTSLQANFIKVRLFRNQICINTLDIATTT